MTGARIGVGFDIHPFSDDPQRPLVLGGVVVVDGPGLAGHSDADVVVHAVADALLGAAGLGDLGTLFPDSDPAWRGADTRAREQQSGYEQPSDLSLPARTSR